MRIASGQTVQTDRDADHNTVLCTPNGGKVTTAHGSLGLVF